MRKWGSIAWIRTKRTNFILVLNYANSFTLYLQDSTEWGVFILYNHNFNLQMTKTWVRDGEASFHSVLVTNIGDPSLVTCVIYHPDSRHSPIHGGRNGEGKTKGSLKNFTYWNVKAWFLIQSYIDSASQYQWFLFQPSELLTQSKVTFSTKLSFLDFTRIAHKEEYNKILLKTEGLTDFYIPFLHQSK